MGKKNNVVIFSIIVIALIGLVWVGQGFVVAPPSGSFISVPTYGSLACKETSKTVTLPTASTYKSFGDYTTLGCGQSTGQKVINGCTVTLRTPSASEISGVTTSVAEALAYKVCQQGTTCVPPSGDVESIRLKAYGTTVGLKDNVDQLISFPIRNNQYVIAQYNSVSLTGTVTHPTKGRYQISYKPFAILKTDIFQQSTGAFIPTSEDCKLPDSVKEDSLAIKKVTGSTLSSTLTKSQILDNANLQAPDAVMTYISNFVAIPPQQLGYELTDNGNAYCTNKKIYRVETVETPSGTYKVASVVTGDIIRAVDCCNQGDVPTGYACTNFVKVKLSVVDGQQCNNLKPCPQSTWVNVGNNMVAKQSCINNICVPETKVVKCSTNNDCGTNAICEVDINNPENNYCRAFKVVELCGNGVCESSLGETPQQCPKDCTIPPPLLTTNWLLYIIIGVGLLIIIGMVAIAKKKRKF